MAITKPKLPVDAAAFIAAAPDASANERAANFDHLPGARRFKKIQVTMTITPELLAQVDGQSARMGLTRAAFISTALYELLERHTR